MFWNKLRQYGIIATLIVVAVVIAIQDGHEPEPKQTHRLNTVR